MKVFDYRNCKLCNGLGVIPERPRKDEKDFPTLIRCPNCKKDFGKDKHALAIHAGLDPMCGAKMISGIVEILRIEQEEEANER